MVSDSSTERRSSSDRSSVLRTAATTSRNAWSSIGGNGSVRVVRNPWLERRVLNYAHQGGAREAPSSTLVAMRAAVEAGADALELDVHCTVDGHVVVCHDATVDRTTE